MHSLEQSFAEPRVPGGLQYMSVVTHLSTVQIVFMNRFLAEFLDYLGGEGEVGSWPCDQMLGLTCVLAGATSPAYYSCLQAVAFCRDCRQLHFNCSVLQCVACGSACRYHLTPAAVTLCDPFME